jgi:hypothetical protein
MGAAPGGAGGSFLGTAAAAAAGMIGGSLLLSGIRSMTGGTPHAAGAFGTTPAAAASTDQASPWGSAAGGNLSKEAGLDDIGRSPGGRDDGGAGRGQGLLDSNTTTDETQSAANEDTEDTDSADDFEDDDGGGDDGEE